MRTLVAILVLAVGVLSGCAALDREPEAEVPEGCGDCVAEIAELTSALEELPEVTKVRGTHRSTDDYGYLSLGVDLDGDDVVAADLDALYDAVARAAWESGVTPLDVVSIDGKLRNGYAETNLFYFGDDRTDYEQRWGDRPSGTVWTPGSQRPEDAEGCPDQCRAEMRDIARDVSAVPGVRAVTRSLFVPDSPTNGWQAVVTVETDGTDVTEQVAEIVWRSPVQPLEWIDVTTMGPGGDLDNTNFWVDPDDGKDYDRFVTTWGERP